MVSSPLVTDCLQPGAAFRMCAAKRTIDTQAILFVTNAYAGLITQCGGVNWFIWCAPAASLSCFASNSAYSCVPRGHDGSIRSNISFDRGAHLQCQLNPKLGIIESPIIYHLLEGIK